MCLIKSPDERALIVSNSFSVSYRDAIRSCGADTCIDALVDRVKVATFMGADRAHMLRHAIHVAAASASSPSWAHIAACWAGFRWASAINHDLSFRMAQPPVQRYLPGLLRRSLQQISAASQRPG